MKQLYIIVLFFSSLYSFGQNYLDFHFKSRGVKGGIVIQNESGSYFAASDEFEGHKSSPPSSLYLMFSYLMVMDHFIGNEQQQLKWDGVSRSFFNQKRDSWNKDSDLNQAFLNKNDWYFQEYLSKINKEQIVMRLKEIGFTNAQWNNEIPYYWQFGGLMVTPEQNISFIKKLVNKQLPFSIAAQEQLLNLLKISEQKGMKLFGMEGYTIYMGERVEWFVGYFEKESKRYYFSTRTLFNIENEFEPANGQQKFILTSTIFDELNLL